MELGTHNSELSLPAPATIHASARVAALLDSVPHPEIQSLPYDKNPFWSLERARIGDSREVPVELVVNGKGVQQKQIVADGAVHDVAFDVPIEQSSWVAVRILPAAHTNPIFILVGGKPIRASGASAEWCLNAVHQCWTQKAPRIAPDQLSAARAAYDHAQQVYKNLKDECERR
jgi:hypothetical protein